MARLKRESIECVNGWYQPCGERDLMARVWTAAREEIGCLLNLCTFKGVEAVVQAGGHTGVWPSMLADIFERVYTFEPHPVNFNCLTANVGHLDNVYAFRAALGQSSPPRRLVERSKSGSHQVLCNAFGPLPVLPLDSLNLDRLDVLSLDVETFELQALRGARETIYRHHPIILVEATGLDPVDGRNEYYAHKQDWLKGCGYREVHQVNKNGIWKHAA